MKETQIIKEFKDMSAKTDQLRGQIMDREADLSGIRRGIEGSKEEVIALEAYKADLEDINSQIEGKNTQLRKENKSIFNDSQILVKESSRIEKETQARKAEIDTREAIVQEKEQEQVKTEESLKNERKALDLMSKVLKKEIDEINIKKEKIQEIINTL